MFKRVHFAFYFLYIDAIYKTSYKSLTPFSYSSGMYPNKKTIITFLSSYGFF